MNEALFTFTVTSRGELLKQQDVVLLGWRKQICIVEPITRQIFNTTKYQKHA